MKVNRNKSTSPSTKARNVYISVREYTNVVLSLGVRESTYFVMTGLEIIDCHEPWQLCVG